MPNRREAPDWLTPKIYKPTEGTKDVQQIEPIIKGTEGIDANTARQKRSELFGELEGHLFETSDIMEIVEGIERLNAYSFRIAQRYPQETPYLLREDYSLGFRAAIRYSAVEPNPLADHYSPHLRLRKGSLYRYSTEFCSCSRRVRTIISDCR